MSWLLFLLILVEYLTIPGLKLSPVLLVSTLGEFNDAVVIKSRLHSHNVSLLLLLLLRFTTFQYSFGIFKPLMSFTLKKNVIL